jgi:ubiquinone/menaquinone biosynthesis C-methylase UbiE
MKNTLKTTPDRDFANRKQFFNILVASEDLKNKKVLDIGCGYGAFILHALENRALEVSGIEISDEDLKTAGNSIKNRNVILKKASALDLPFPDNYFDIVVCFEVLEHVENVEQAIRESLRVLKPGGCFFGSTPFALALHERPFDCRRFSSYGIQALFSQFQTVSLKETSGYLETVSLSILRLLVLPGIAVKVVGIFLLPLAIFLRFVSPLVRTDVYPSGYLFLFKKPQ